MQCGRIFLRLETAYRKTIVFLFLFLSAIFFDAFCIKPFETPKTLIYKLMSFLLISSFFLHILRKFKIYTFNKTINYIFSTIAGLLVIELFFNTSHAAVNSITISLLFFANVYVISIFSLKYPETKKVILISLLLATFCISGYAIVQYFGFPIWPFKPFSGKRKIFSFLGNPNLVAAYLAIALPIIIYCITYFKSKIFKWIIIFILIFNLFSLILTRSYTLIIVCLLYGICLTIYLFKNKPIILTMLLILFSIAVTGSYILSEKFLPAKLKYKLASKLKIRFFLLKTGMFTLKNSFIFGIGSGNLERKYILLQKKYLNSLSKNKPDSSIPRAYKSFHNDLLDFIVETGIRGVLIFLIISAGTIILLLKLIKKGSSFFLMATLSLITFFTFGMFHGILTCKAITALMCVIYSLIISTAFNKNEIEYKSILFEDSIFYFLIAIFLIFQSLTYFYVKKLGLRLKAAGKAFYLASQKSPDNIYFAEKFLKHSLELSPYDSETLLLYAKTSSVLSRYKEALEYFEKSIKNSENLSAYLGIATTLSNIGQLSQAEKYFKKFSNFMIAGYQVEFLNNYAVLKLKKGEVKKAENMLAKALDYANLTHDSKYLLNIYMNLARAHFILKNYKKMELFLKKANSLSKSNLSLKYWYAYALFKTGKINLAKAQLKKLLKTKNIPGEIYNAAVKLLHLISNKKL